jgi:hypothetical protein
MVWTGDPKTWAFQEGVESSELNTEMRDRFLSMGPHLIARKTSDENVTTTTLQDDDALTFPVAANEVWLFKVNLLVVTGAGGMKSSFSFPASGLLTASLVGVDSTGGLDVQPQRLTVTDGSTVSYAASSSGRLYFMEGVYENAGTGGTVTLRNALTTASGTSTIRTNSTVWGVKLA